MFETPISLKSLEPCKLSTVKIFKLNIQLDVQRQSSITPMNSRHQPIIFPSKLSKVQLKGNMIPKMLASFTRNNK